MKISGISCCTIILIFCCHLSYGQKQNSNDQKVHPLSRMESRMALTSIPLPQGESDTIGFLVSYFTGKLGNLDNNNSTSLHLSAKIKSPAGIHYTFIQTVFGIPIYSSQVKANFDRNGNIRSYFDFTFPVNNPESDFPPDSNSSMELSLRYPAGKGLLTWSIDSVYFPDCIENAEGRPEFIKLIPALLVTVNDSLNRNYELVIDKNGKVIFENDLNRYFIPNSNFASHLSPFTSHLPLLTTDSLVPALVFLPDPLTTAEVSYGAPYNDNGDADSPELNNQRKIVSLKVSYSGGIFYMESSWVKIVDIESPYISPATSAIPDFSFTRSDDRFEDVNVFYHINTFQEYIRTIGFTNLAAYKINADAHARSGDDNSMYADSTIFFGEGYVDDAEDADVIIHEYGHAIQESAAPGTLYGTQRKSLDEANGDYLASSYSRSLSEFAWDKVFTWDGHNRWWPGRWSTSTKCYPDDVTNNYYQFADIWSSTLMQIWFDIGRDTTDMLLLQSLYNYAGNMTMADAAKLFLQADTLLFGASHADTCFVRMSDRGLLGKCKYASTREEAGTSHSEFFSLKNPAFATLDFGFPLYDDYSIQIFSTAGANLVNGEFSGSGRFQIPLHGLSQGIYMVRVNNNEFSDVRKLVKY